MVCCFGFLITVKRRRRFMENFSALAVNLENINKCLSGLIKKSISAYGLNQAHFNVIMHIDMNQGGLTPTEIANICDIDKSFVSRVISFLVEHEFVQTDSKQGDGRKYKKKFVLTDKGVAVMDETKSLIKQHFVLVSEKVSLYEMRNFLHVIRVFVETVSGLGDDSSKTERTDTL
jgi:DNA-binding MarR family transcriptional regulator